ncbi:MAG TPA: HAMP domain-containing sensor histidine kinase [Gemmataceae bacterium]|jgi:signal transduction histidine kinase|nr:HAMP domain-containing sensor histidine kinase [Gemmataceae bacterium]
MKSIRRTLLLNVLLLLIVTLGVVTYVVYYTAAGALRERQQAATELAHVRYEDRRDEALRARADKLASEVQSNWNSTNFRNQWVASEVAAVMAPMGPGNPAALIPRAGIMGATTFGRASQLAFEVHARLATELKLNEEEIYAKPDVANYEYIQVTSDAGGTWTSRSLAGETLPSGFPILHRDPDGHPPRFDTVSLPSGVEVRRVTIRANVTRYSRVGNFFLQRPARPEDSVPPSRAVVGLAGAIRAPRPVGGPGGGPFFRPQPEGPENTIPVFYIQCAWNTSADAPQIEEMIRTRDQQLSAIDQETERSIRNLRATLAWSVSGAFAATLIGGWILVGAGLFPLKRLSQAVSEINPKDFRLPLDPRTLPSEVNPVADRLSRALTQLQAAFEREKRAAADISHELRTPLAALTTTIEVSCRKVRSAEQYRQTLDECRVIAKQMSLLVERMLALAWLDAGVDEVRPQSVEVTDLVGGVAAIAKPLAEVQGLSFKVNVPNRLTVRTDPDKLREVVMNLTHNAIEYNRPGGEIELTATQTTSGIVVEVRDTGIGMAPEIQDKIFERFFRADPSRQATGAHAGLGLAIVKEYVDRLGGRLTVDSTLGRGSRFRIELPNAL